MNEREAPPVEKTPLDRAVRVWRKAQIVHQTPSWDGRPEARAIAEEIAQHPEYEPLLLDLLADPSQLVAAYSLMALELMGSARLKELPAGLLANRSNITVAVGSVRIGMDLGGLARQVQKRAAGAAS